MCISVLQIPRAGLHLVPNNGAVTALGMNAFWRGKDSFYTATDETMKVVEVATSPAIKAAIAKPVLSFRRSRP